MDIAGPPKCGSCITLNSVDLTLVNKAWNFTVYYQPPSYTAYANSLRNWHHDAWCLVRSSSTPSLVDPMNRCQMPDMVPAEVCPGLSQLNSAPLHTVPRPGLNVTILPFG